jgi:hypothetical protein
MKAHIEVKDRREKEALERGLAHPEVRAFVLVIGIMDTLPTDSSRARVLEYFENYFRDERRENHATQARKLAEGGQSEHPH